MQGVEDSIYSESVLKLMKVVNDLIEKYGSELLISVSFAVIDGKDGSIIENHSLAYGIRGALAVLVQSDLQQIKDSQEEFIGNP